MVVEMPFLLGKSFKQDVTMMMHSSTMIFGTFLNGRETQKHRVQSFMNQIPRSMRGMCCLAAQISTCADTSCSSFVNSLSALIYCEVAFSENGKDLFYTIDDVLGSSFVRSTLCFLLACANAIESLCCMKINLGGLHEKVWCTLDIHKIDVKVVRWMRLENDWGKWNACYRCTCKRFYL